MIAAGQIPEAMEVVRQQDRRRGLERIAATDGAMATPSTRTAAASRKIIRPGSLPPPSRCTIPRTCHHRYSAAPRLLLLRSTDQSRRVGERGESTSGSHLPGCIDAPQPTSGPAGRTPRRAGGGRRWVALVTHPAIRIGRTRRIGRMVTGGGLRSARPTLRNESAGRAASGGWRPALRRAALTHPTKRIGQTRRMGGWRPEVGCAGADPPYETNRPDAPHRAGGDRRWAALRRPTLRNESAGRPGRVAAGPRLLRPADLIATLSERPVVYGGCRAKPNSGGHGRGCVVGVEGGGSP